MVRILYPQLWRGGELLLSMRGVGVEFGAKGEWKNLVAATMGNLIRVN